MMKIFDLHADIGYDILNRKQEDPNAFRNHHLPKLLKGEVMAVGMVSFFEGTETLEYAKNMVSYLREQILTNSDLVLPYYGGDLHSTKINALMTVEGMCYIHDHVEETLDWLYDQGVRIASLTWNEENDLATGTKGNPARGLTEMGIKAVHHMNKIGMIIDVSHLNEKSFWDVLEHSSKPIIATHSNTRVYANVDRNLTNQQVKALINQKGLMGLNAAKYFVHDDETLQNVHYLAKHAQVMADLGGIECIAVGFDYMDYLNPPFGRDVMAKEIQDASESQNLISALYKLGFTEHEVQKIAYQNVLDFLTINLK